MISLYAKNVGGVWFGVAYEGERVFATYFASNEKDTLQGLRRCIPFDAPFQQAEKPSAFAERVIATLKNVYDGKEIDGIPNLAMEHLSEHAQKVLKVTALIPVGYVSSYGAIAKAAGTAPRGVGRVMAMNPFSPIVPCHRVVGSDFSLVGYGGGLDNKLKFLKRERKGFASKLEIAVNGKKLVIYPVEFVLKKVEKS
jgi:O-6-methylguanine DNA methyltransferase